MLATLMPPVLPGTSSAVALDHPPPSTSTAPPVDMTVHGDSLVVVGDLTVAPPGSNANARAVHDLTVSLHPAAIVLAGDLVHPAASLSQLNNTFDPVWGDQWQRIAPAIGNHDYNLGHSSGWASTGGRARPRNASYHSFNVVLPQGGHWHVIVLNSACGDYSNQPAWVTPAAR